MFSIGAIAFSRKTPHGQAVIDIMNTGVNWSEPYVQAGADHEWELVVAIESGLVSQNIILKSAFAQPDYGCLLKYNYCESDYCNIIQIFHVCVCVCV